MEVNETSGHVEAPLTLLFDVRNHEEVEALHYWRSAFGPASEIEAVNENLFALHLFPGLWCWERSGEAA